MNDSMIEISERLFSSLFDRSMIDAYIVDYYTNEILAISDTLARTLNKSRAEIIGTSCFETIKGNHLCANCPVKNDRFSYKEMGYLEQFQSYFHNRHEWRNVSLNLIRWHEKRKALLICYEEATGGEISSRQFGHLDVWDNKFVLPNSLGLERDFSKLPSGLPATLICFGIVSLRTINDSYGRKVGDMLLFAIRDWLLSLRLGQLYRLESDEFGLLLLNTDLKAALNTAGGIYERFKEPWDIGLGGETRQLFCTVSMGVIENSTIGSADNILNVIERILIIASEQEEIAVYNEDLSRTIRRRMEIEVSLKSCMKNNMTGFGVHYQPIINSTTGLWCGIEVLCRWNSPSLGHVAPLEFIPIAEQQGLIGTLGEWVLEESVKQCKQWHLDDHADFFLEINVSPIQLLDENLDLKFLKILEKYDFPNHKLCLEITESMQLNFDSHTLAAIFRLAEKDIKIALDDFGTGYSSFHSLANLPVSTLKSERIFIKNIENDKYLQRLLEMMVSLSHASGMKMTAEGVETSTQMKILRDSRVDFVQGYLFSKPLPAEDFEKRLQNFFTKESFSNAGEYARIDLETLENSENAYSLPPYLYKTLIRCMQVLFNSSNIDEGINCVLAEIGEQLKINRHVLFLKDQGADTFTNTHEWCDKDTVSNIGKFKNVPISQLAPSFFLLFEKEGMLVSPDISLLPEDIRQVFLNIGVKSNIAIPLWRGKELLGYVGLDVCKERRNWHLEEVLMVHSVCGILAGVIDRWILQEEAARKDS